MESLNKKLKFRENKIQKSLVNVKEELEQNYNMQPRNYSWIVN